MDVSSDQTNFSEHSEGGIMEVIVKGLEKVVAGLERSNNSLQKATAALLVATAALQDATAALQDAKAQLTDQIECIKQIASNIKQGELCQAPVSEAKEKVLPKSPAQLHIDAPLVGETSVHVITKKPLSVQSQSYQFEKSEGQNRSESSNKNSNIQLVYFQQYYNQSVKKIRDPRSFMVMSYDSSILSKEDWKFKKSLLAREIKKEKEERKTPEGQIKWNAIERRLEKELQQKKQQRKAMEESYKKTSRFN